MKLWTGPSRAYQTHLTLWTDRQRAIDTLGHSRELPAPLRRWVTMARAFTRIEDGASSAGRERPDIDQQTFIIGNQMFRTEHELLTQGDTYYVAHHLVDLISGAAEQAEAEPIFATDLPTPFGLAVLEHPLVVADLHPDTGVLDHNIRLPIRAIGWAVTDMGARSGEGTIPGVVLIPYTDPVSYNEVYVESLRRVTPQRVESTVDVASSPVLLSTDYHAWGFGVPWTDGGDNYENIPEGTLVSTVAAERRWFLAFMRLMWQQILTPQVIAPVRGLQRKAERVAWPRRDRGIKVMRLRRVQDSAGRDESEESRAWTMTYRSITRGHWRQQYYPSLGPVGAPESYRRIWIHPFVRGPQDAPVVVKHNVTSVTR